MKPTTRRAVRFADASRTDTKELPDNCTPDDFCRHYYGRVFKRAVRKLIGHQIHDIADVVQATFVAFLEKWHFGFETVSARKYLFGVLRGQIGRCYHRPVRQDKQEMEQASELDEDDIPEGLADSSEQEYILTPDVAREFKTASVLNSAEQKMLRLLLTSQQRQRNNKGSLVSRYYEKQARAQIRERLQSSKFFQPANRFDRRQRKPAANEKNKVTVYFLSPEELAKVNGRKQAV